MLKKPFFSNSLLSFLMMAVMATGCMGLISHPDLSHAKATKSLHDRLGGMPAITAVVDDFVNRLVDDKTVGGRFASADVKRFKMLNAELVCMATGGACKYSGKDMKTTHNGMRISEKEFNIVAGHLVKTLKKFKVPKQESQELMAIIGSLKKDIVE